MIAALQVTKCFALPIGLPSKRRDAKQRPIFNFVSDSGRNDHVIVDVDVIFVKWNYF